MIICIYIFYFYNKINLKLNLKYIRVKYIRFAHELKSKKLNEKNMYGERRARKSMKCWSAGEERAVKKPFIGVWRRPDSTWQITSPHPASLHTQSSPNLSKFPTPLFSISTPLYLFTNSNIFICKYIITLIHIFALTFSHHIILSSHFLHIFYFLKR